MIILKEKSKEDAFECFLFCLGKNGSEVIQHPLEGFFGRTGTLAGFGAVELFGGGEE